MTDLIRFEDLPLAEITQHIAEQPVDKNRIKGLTAGNITGQVAAAGTITAGTGFTVNRSATGTYDITFTTAFSATPTILVSLANTSSILRQLRVTTASTTGATVFIATTVADSAAGANEPFNFVAFATV